MAALHCQEAGQTADSRPIIRSMQATRATPALAEETEMTCNKTQRRTHGAANKKGGAERERILGIELSPACGL